MYVTHICTDVLYVIYVMYVSCVFFFMYGMCECTVRCVCMFRMHARIYVGYARMCALYVSYVMCVRMHVMCVRSVCMHKCLSCIYCMYTM